MQGSACSSSASGQAHDSHAAGRRCLLVQATRRASLPRLIVMSTCAYTPTGTRRRRTDLDGPALLHSGGRRGQGRQLAQLSPQVLLQRARGRPQLLLPARPMFQSGAWSWSKLNPSYQPPTQVLLQRARGGPQLLLPACRMLQPGPWSKLSPSHQPLVAGVLSARSRQVAGPAPFRARGGQAGPGPARACCVLPVRQA